MPPADKMAGFFMGPDGYVWGRDFLERHPAPGPRPLVMEKQWYSFMLWGRLAYDPSLPDSRFERILTARQPMEQTTPLEIADALDGAVAKTVASLDTLREAAREDSELHNNVNDCEATAWLGRYYMPPFATPTTSRPFTIAWATWIAPR
jgi:hypothetical protein